MIRVSTGSRLHFGLIGLAADAPRRFGGVGLMVEHPGLSLHIEPAAAWSASGPHAERALAYARRFAANVAVDSPQRIVVEHAPPEHVGLGTGTQLGLAVARGLAAAWRLDPATTRLAEHVGRGLRSALGIHGFDQGGFLVDGGKGGGTNIAPLLARVPFPAEWRVILITSADAPGLHGSDELNAFERMDDSSQADALCRLVLLGLIPALLERDLSIFGEALYEFNHRVGMAFAAAQGGPYASPAAAKLVDWFRGQGIQGVGQSSWGPTVFAIVENEEVADALTRLLKRESGTVAIVTAARNAGATIAGS